MMEYLEAALMWALAGARIAAALYAASSIIVEICGYISRWIDRVMDRMKP